MTARNPLIPQCWLFSVDTERGDLLAHGFQRPEHPEGATRKTSLYALNGMFLQANSA